MLRVATSIQALCGRYSVGATPTFKTKRAVLQLLYTKALCFATGIN